MTSAVSRERNFGLDLARAMAISGVFLAHGFTFTGIPVLDDLRTGVDLFFVLSGFLIGRIYFRSYALGTFSLGPFWLSRWWRTLPPYFAAVALHALLSHWVPELRVAWYYLLFLQNQIGMLGFPPSWSLCVEEHFYLLLPILGGLFLRFFDRARLLWLLPVAFLLPLAALYLAKLEPNWPVWRSPVPQGFDFRTQFRCEGLIGGVWLALVFVERPLIWQQLKKFARFACWIIPVLLVVDPVHSLGRSAATLYAFGYLALVRTLFDLKWNPEGRPGVAAKRAITGLALAAYSIYLCHYLCFEILRSHILSGMHRGTFKTVLTLSCSFFFCTIFYFLVEKPSIRSRDRFIAARQRRGLLPLQAPALSK